jgi:hypothetical protein
LNQKDEEKKNPSPICGCKIVESIKEKIVKSIK